MHVSLQEEHMQLFVASFLQNPAIMHIKRTLK